MSASFGSNPDGTTMKIKYCKDCPFVRYKDNKLICVNKQSRYYWKEFDINAHACK